jgi:hypothetical protein
MLDLRPPASFPLQTDRRTTSTLFYPTAFGLFSSQSRFHRIFPAKQMPLLKATPMPNIRRKTTNPLSQMSYK